MLYQQVLDMLSQGHYGISVQCLLLLHLGQNQTDAWYGVLARLVYLRSMVVPPVMMMSVCATEI